MESLGTSGEEDSSSQGPEVGEGAGVAGAECPGAGRRSEGSEEGGRDLLTQSVQTVTAGCWGAGSHLPGALLGLWRCPGMALVWPVHVTVTTLWEKWEGFRICFFAAVRSH